VVQVVERVLKRLLGRPGRWACRGGGADDPGRARPVAGGRDPVQAAPLRRVHHDLGADLAPAIVARSLNVPAVVATHKRPHADPRERALIVDGSNSVVIVNPDKSVLAEYRLKQGELGSSAPS